MANQFVTIGANPGYVALRNCAASCVSEPLGGLPSFIGCENALVYDVFYNNCYCKTNFLAQATSFLSTCITSACGDNGEFSSAVTAYEGYCSTAGIPLNVAAQTTTGMRTTVSATTTTYGGSVATTVTTHPPTTATATAFVVSTTTLVSAFNPSTLMTSSTSLISSTSLTSSNSQNTGGTSSGSSGTTDSGSKLNLGPIIGGAVGGVFAIGIIAIIITWMILRDRRKRRVIDLNQSRPRPPEEPNYGTPELASKSVTVNRRPVPLTAPISPRSLASPVPAPSIISSPPVYVENNPEMDGHSRRLPEMQGVPDSRPGYYEVHE